jgi:hypothetical protein
MGIKVVSEEKQGFARIMLAHMGESSAGHSIREPLILVGPFGPHQQVKALVKDLEALVKTKAAFQCKRPKNGSGAIAKGAQGLCQGLILGS